MNRTFWLCTGLVGGSLLTLGIRYALREPEQARRAPPEIVSLTARLTEEREKCGHLQAALDDAERRAAALTAANEKLAKALEDAGSGAGADPERKPAAPSAHDAAPTDEEILAAVGDFGEALDEIVQGGGEEAKRKLRDLLARAGKPGVDLLVAKFEDDATDIGLRIAIAHALAQSGNPDAVASLTKVLADPEAEMVSLRLASSGLAFSDAPGIDDSLLRVAHQAADTGARANAAFGLARRRNPEGIGLYLKATDEAMANRDPAALQYLGGFALLGEDALPPLRERLLSYTEPQAAITVIEILKARGDKGAVENLRKLAADEGRHESIRKAAEGALKALEGAK